MHCYTSSKCDLIEEELSTDQAKKLLCQLADIKCPVVLFSGGEPLLRKDIFELLIHAKRLGIRTVLSTNGTLIDPDTAKKIVDADVGYVGVSIDGDEKVHDEFRQSNGSFNAAIRGIENCRNAGVKTGIRFTITRLNHHLIKNVFKIAVSSAVRRICFYHLIRTGRAGLLNNSDGDNTPAEQTMSLTVEQTRRTMDLIIEMTAKAVKDSVVDEVLTVGNHADGPYLLVQMAQKNDPNIDVAKKLLLSNGGNKIGEKLFCVGWQGNLYPDQFFRNYSLGSVKHSSVKDIISRNDDPVLDKLTDKHHFAHPRCLTCKWFEYCKGNYRFLGKDPAPQNWQNEPPCYLTDEQIAK
jgi:radical SAM protein with 4Fe4S-binding SPASM domain